jgi:hypothetical protein
MKWQEVEENYMMRRVFHIGYWWESQENETTRETKMYMADNIKIYLRDVGWDVTD